MKKFYKSLLVFGSLALILTLSACGTDDLNAIDNMDTQAENIVPKGTNGSVSNNGPDLGEFSAQANPDKAAVVQPVTTDKAADSGLSSQVLEPSKQADLLAKYSGAIIKTNLGDIKVKFYNTDSPMTVNNFLHLAQAGFYNDSKFHRVIKDFMIQGGDPNSKDDDWSNDGFGGPGYYFKDEINTHKLVKGSLAMANSGAGTSTNGSQFFIVTAAATPWLDGAHTNFGEVVSGLEVVTNIEQTEVNGNDHPTKDMIIKSIELIP